jgi:transposase
MYIKVEGSPSLYRDMTTGAIINTSEEEIKRARETKKLHLQNKKEQKEVHSEVAFLKSEITQLKQMVKELLENK